MAETKWLGKYRAIVMDNNDPERRGRIRVQCPTVLGDYLSSWCEPCIPYATDYAGDYYVPPVSEAIWVEFEEGDVDKPIWGGGWYKIDSSPLTQDANPTDYRYIVFKNSVLRMGEKEFIFELRDGDDSYTVVIDTSTWLGLNYIGSKSEQELSNLNELIEGKEWIFDTFPKEVYDLIDATKQEVTDMLNNFINTAYNPAMEDISSRLETIENSLIELSPVVNETYDNLRELQRQVDDIDGNLRNLQGQIDEINIKIDNLTSRTDTNVQAYNDTLTSMTDNPTDWIGTYMS